MPLPPIPAPFTTRKSNILASLSQPDDSYTDLSPKGSVDAGIRDLIAEINAVDGLVTTSSCAGRISVFLEGKKGAGRKVGQGDDADGVEGEGDGDGMRAEGKAVPGGKGMGGRWLFVSHEPVDVPAIDENGGVMGMFGMENGAAEAEDGMDVGAARLVRFQFEPMILHIQTASLPHASLVLSSTLNAGFRESGVQSLKALDDANAFPMVAVRTAGLGLSSIVGCAVDDGDAGAGSATEVRSLVGEGYLRMMLRLGNERFVENRARIERFRAELRRAVGRGVDGGGGGLRSGQWEDGRVRAERMRREGLERRAAMGVRGEVGVEDGGVEDDVLDGPLFLPG